MKGYLLLILLICTTFQTQTTFSQVSGNQIDFFKSNLNELLDENGNSIFNANDLDTTILTGEATGQNFFGYSVSTAGDVNDDGYSDIIVGAKGYNDFKGRAYIYFGGVNMDNVADVTMTGEEGGNYFGHSVSSAGDVNNDGFSDIIVGANGFGSQGGRAYIFYGGFSMDNVADVIMTGESSSSLFGASVSTAGDVNNDGFSDVVVGAYSYQNQTGKVYIFFGGSSMNNGADVTMEGESFYSYFGNSVSSAGDVNSDGFSDIIVGAYNYSSGIGRSYIFYGGSSMNNVTDVTMTGEVAGDYFGYSVSTAGDVNGDGFSDVIIGADGHHSPSKIGRAYIFYGDSLMNNVADVTLIGEAYSSFGYSVSCAGDVNGDSYSDVVVGAYQYSNEKGRTHIFYGDSPMNNVADVTITGEGTYDRFGYSVSSAGDVNGDGYSDLVIGADGYSSQIGRSYIFFNIQPKPELFIPINNSVNNPETLTFKWKKFNASLYYILNVSTDSDFSNIIVNDTIFIDTSITVKGLLKDTKYYWRVKAKDTSGITFNSSIWNFTTIPPIYSNIKLLFEGMYSPFYNQLIRKDSVTAYLHQSAPPYNIIDSAKTSIDTLSFSGLFKFFNATTGNYYISVKHFNSLETWSKTGGEYLATDGIFYNYDFTTANTQAYGNNLKLKGSKYCLYSGDVNQDGYISLNDVISIYNDATNFLSGRFIVTDVTGDNIVDLSDITICNNNSSNFVSKMTP